MASQDAGREGPVDTEPVNQGRPRSKVVGGRFVIERLIARGGMGAVYLAHQLNLGRPVAVKIMTPPPDGEDGDTFEERFRLEAETLASLHHPNIVTVYDYGPTDDGRYYLALEYIEGPRFTDLIRKGRMAPERVVRLMLQVCNALQYSHRRGVVHRDLKPSNLLVRVEDGVETVKVVDFGLVKVIEADQSLTRAGLVLGSPHCMAPEQVRGEDIDHRADIYAIGVLLFRALTGTWPFHGETVASTMIAHVHEERPTFFSVAPDLMVPDGLEDITRKCMARAPADRFQDVGALMEALAGCLDVPKEQFLTVSSYHSSLKGQPAGAAPTPGNDRRWVPFAVIGALLVGLLGLAYLRPWEPDATPTGPVAQGSASSGTAAPASVIPALPAADAPAGAAVGEGSEPSGAPTGQGLVGEDGVVVEGAVVDEAGAAGAAGEGALAGEGSGSGEAAAGAPAGTTGSGTSASSATSAPATQARATGSTTAGSSSAGKPATRAQATASPPVEPGAAPPPDADAPEGYLGVPEELMGAGSE